MTLQKTHKPSVGQRVRWNNHDTHDVITGTIVGIVPAGERPDDGVYTTDEHPRDHESYVVCAEVVSPSDSKRTEFRLFWPQVDLLRVITQFDGKEVVASIDGDVLRIDGFLFPPSRPISPAASDASPPIKNVTREAIRRTAKLLFDRW